MRKIVFVFFILFVVFPVFSGENRDINQAKKQTICKYSCKSRLNYCKENNCRILRVGGASDLVVDSCIDRCEDEYDRCLQKCD
jgi:hypothetical protein